MKTLAASFLAVFLSLGSVWADAGTLAKEASATLLAAAGQLAKAETATDRIAALTETVRAYETGLSAMREGLRQAALRERVLTEDLAAEDADLSALLVLMESASRQVRSRTLLHPGTALETIRAGTLGALLVPALHQRAATLDDALTELGTLIDLQESGVATLEDGLSGIRDARLRLTEAVAERSDLPPRVATDEAAMEALINSAETLSGFADSLLPEDVVATDGPDRPWPMPVKGELLRGFNEADASGQRRPGWIISTNAKALITSPSDATVRFSGEIPGQGTVTILEPEGGTLLILAGLGESFVRREQIVARNDPIGFMGDGHASAQENLNSNPDKSSLFGSETLYMEVRQGRLPVDPADILTLGQQ